MMGHFARDCRTKGKGKGEKNGRRQGIWHRQGQDDEKNIKFSSAHIHVLVVTPISLLCSVSTSRMEEDIPFASIDFSHCFFYYVTCLHRPHVFRITTKAMSFASSACFASFFVLFMLLPLGSSLLFSSFGSSLPHALSPSSPSFVLHCWCPSPSAVAVAVVLYGCGRHARGLWVLRRVVVGFSHHFCVRCTLVHLRKRSVVLVVLLLDLFSITVV